jgi:formiminoglutamate deiminase
MSRAIVEAARETGIALTHLPVFYAQGGFGGQAPGEAQRRFLHDVDGFARLVEALGPVVANLPDAVLGVAPHSLRATTGEQLRAVAALSPGPVHIHIAEQEKEVADCLAWSGARPVDWLLDNAPVGPEWCLVHATHVTPDEARRMREAGVVAGLCPITEANLGDGIFPAEQFGGAIGVGSDSNVLIDATEELRLLEYGQRLARRRRNLFAGPGGSTGGALYRAALAGGGQALGAVSAIAAGPADFVTLDMDHVSLAGRRGDAILDGLIFAAGSRAIDGVWRRGRQVVRGGRHVERDRIAARYRRTLKDLLG